MHKMGTQRIIKVNLKILLFLSVSILLFNCHNDVTEEPDLEVIDFYSNPGKELERISEIALGVELISFKDTLSEYPGIIKLASASNKYFVLLNSYDIICIDSTGKFLGKMPGGIIGNSGYIRDFDIASDGEQIIIAGQDRLYLFDIANNTFKYRLSIRYMRTPDSNEPGLGSTRFPCRLSFVPDQSSILLSFFNQGVEPNRNIVIDYNGETLDIRPNSYRYTKSKQMGFDGSGIVQQYVFKDKIFFKDIFCDTVFCVNLQNQIYPVAIIDSHGHQLKTSVLTGLSKSKIERLLNSYRVTDIFETSRFFICKILDKNREYFSIHDKDRNKFYRTSQEVQFFDDLVTGLRLGPLYCDGEDIYSWLSVSGIQNQISNEAFKKTSGPSIGATELHPLINIPEGDENLLIVKVLLKK